MHLYLFYDSDVALTNIRRIPLSNSLRMLLKLVHWSEILSQLAFPYLSKCTWFGLTSLSLTHASNSSLSVARKANVKSRLLRNKQDQFTCCWSTIGVVLTFTIVVNFLEERYFFSSMLLLKPGVLSPTEK